MLWSPIAALGLAFPNGGKGWDTLKGEHLRNGGIGGSLFLVALGAILYWAVNVEAEGFSINTIGLILLIVGVVGLVLTLIMTASTTESDRDVTIVER